MNLLKTLASAEIETTHSIAKYHWVCCFNVKNVYVLCIKNLMLK